MTPNEDEFQKSVRTKFRFCLGVLEFAVILSITCILVETDFEIGHFSQLSDIRDLDLGQDHTAYRRVAILHLSCPRLPTKFR